MINKEYYLVAGGERKGPYTYNELCRMDLDIHTEVVVSPEEESQYISELPEFNSYFESKGVYFPTQDNLASFGKRAIAFVIDYFGIYFIVEIIETQTGLVVLPKNLSLGMAIPRSMITLYISFFVAFLLYNTIFESTNLKGSLGKKICRLSVVDIDGQGISILRALGRNLGVLLSVTIWIPFLSIFFSEYRQEWYDSLAKTYIIETPVKPLR